MTFYNSWFQNSPNWDILGLYNISFKIESSKGNKNCKENQKPKVWFDKIIAVQTHHPPHPPPRNSTSTRNIDPRGLKFCRRPYQAKLTTIQQNFGQKDLGPKFFCLKKPGKVNPRSPTKFQTPRIIISVRSRVPVGGRRGV